MTETAVYKSKDLKEIGTIIDYPITAEGNNSDHWTKKRKRRLNQQALIKSWFNTLGTKITLPCEITLTRLSPRELDYDNLVISFKAVRDCIADLIIPGKAPGQADSCFEISWSYDQFKISKESKFKIKIVF